MFNRVNICIEKLEKYTCIYAQEKMKITEKELADKQLGECVRERRKFATFFTLYHLTVL